MFCLKLLFKIIKFIYFNNTFGNFKNWRPTYIFIIFVLNLYFKLKLKSLNL